jgi:hypothetical protein
MKALTKNISISIVSIKGEEVNLKILGKLPDLTQGDLNIVDPVNITEEFSDIVDSKIVAKDVTAKLFLHKSLQFSETFEGEVINEFCRGKNIGIAYQDSEFTFEFQFRQEEIQKIKNINEDLKIPFQVQIIYTKPDGMKCIRVISQTREISFDREKVEKNLDTGIIAQHFNYTTATKAQSGDVQQALDDRFSVQNLIQRNVQSSQDMENLDTFVGYTSNMGIGQQETENDNNQNMFYNMRSKRKKPVSKTQNQQRNFQQQYQGNNNF